MKNIFHTLILERNPKYVELLEEKYKINLPPVFKAFVQTFEFGKFSPSSEHFVIHRDKDICYDDFELNLEENIRVFYDQDDLYTKPKLLPIMSSCYHFGICLGIGEKNADQIILYKDIGHFQLISNNILEFITQLKEIHWDDV